MLKAFFIIILPLCSFAVAGELQVPGKLSVGGYSEFRGSCAVINSGLGSPYSLAVGTSGAYNLVVTTAGNVGIGNATAGSARLAVIGDSGTAFSLAVGTCANFNFAISTSGTAQFGGNAQFGGTINRGTYTVMDSSMLDGFTLEIDTTTNKIKLADRIEQNILSNAFESAVAGKLAKFGMVDGFMDEFEDESGVDTVASSSQAYNSTGHYYSPRLDIGGLDSYTKLLIHFNGADGAASYIAETGQTVTFFNHAKLTTAQKEFGSASLALDGTDDYVTVPDSTDWALGDTYTIDFWVRFNVLKDTFFGGQFIGSGNYWYLYYYSGTTWSFTCLGYGSGGGNATFTYTATQNEWIHVAVSVSGGTGSFYINGVKGTSTANLTVGDYPADLLIGKHNGGNVNGWMDEFRISKGIARYSTNFTPPVSEYMSSSGLQNMTLKALAFPAQAQPAKARLVLFEEDVDAVALNTDLKSYVSRDGGSTWTYAALTAEGNFNTGKRILSSAVIDISTQPSGSSMKWEVTTHNQKNLKLHGVGMNWD